VPSRGAERFANNLAGELKTLWERALEQLAENNHPPSTYADREGIITGRRYRHEFLRHIPAVPEGRPTLQIDFLFIQHSHWETIFILDVTTWTLA
jgi:hypothetical protein